METVIITGSSGLIGSEAVRFFSEKNFLVIGVDNDMRKEFFGDEASTEWNRKQLEEQFKDFHHYSLDIRSEQEMEKLFRKYGSEVDLIVHCAAQPSHDWAAKDPIKDFSVNANGTLVLLEMARKHCPEAVFTHLSTNKVYGDVPNEIKLKELPTRWDYNDPSYLEGIPETLRIDRSKHSLFGASKLAADILVQEYGRYFDMKTCCLRGGCLTGPNHSGVELHGFLSYLAKVNLENRIYNKFRVSES